MLTDGPRQLDDLSAICHDLCGASLAERLCTDIDVFQNVGLGALNANTRRDLLEFYEAEKPNPYAHEIVAWLRGEYLFDPQCLTT